MKSDDIKKLRAAGFILFPCRGKVPAKEGVNWRDTTLNQYSETELAANNYGIAIAPDVMVIDVDPRNFAALDPVTGDVVPRFNIDPNTKEKTPNPEAKGFPIDRPLQRLIAKVGPLADTFRVKTGGGGMHVFVRIPEGFDPVGKLDEYPGIDFKHLGGYVIGPGSIHPDTKMPYEIVHGAPDKLLPAPQALLDLVKRPAMSLSGSGTGDYKDDKITREQYINYLENVAAPSIEGRGGNHNAFKVACHGRDLALPPQVTWELMLGNWNTRCVPPWEPEELRPVVIHAYQYAAGPLGSSHPEADFKGVPLPATVTAVREPKVEIIKTGEPANPVKIHEDDLRWDLNKMGVPLKNFHNLTVSLRDPSRGMHKIFGYNQFTMSVEFVRPAPWHRGSMPTFTAVTDDDLKLLKSHLASRHQFEQPISEIEHAIVVVAKNDYRFHPVRDYLESLKWDGKPRIDFWLRDYVGAIDEGYPDYLRAVSRKVLCSAVMRAMAPGCKADCTLVLEGDQDLGKSSVCAILGGEWAGDFPIDPHNKDTVQLMQGKWIVELAELEVTGRTETDALKAFLTRRVDKVRLAYGRLPIEFPRQSIFIATKNPGGDNTYLKDDTGNRRWWPVMCVPRGGQVDFQGLKDARDQLFAEAVHHIRDRGEKLYMDTPALKAQAKAVVAMRHADHPFTEGIGKWLDGKSPLPTFLTAHEIFIGALGGIEKQFDRKYQNGIGQAMKSLGWVTTVSKDGRKVRGYEPGAGARSRAAAVPAPSSIEDEGISGDSLEREAALGVNEQVDKMLEGIL